MRARLALVVAVVVAVVVGWAHTWFLCDDAYIAFRYVSNEIAGRGFVWNPAPFAPVEGYTSFLWVALLDVVWRVTGVEPPEASTVLSLVCGYVSLGLAAAFVARAGLGRWLPLVLLGVVTNRTFLTWLSSGLETALFDACFLAWIYEATAEAPRPVRLSLAAALAALARPDGLLCVLATPLVARPAWPLLAVAVHLLWRRWTYGEWLPNTWAAKVGEPWPEAGWRYAASFVVENGVWVWVLLVLARLRRVPRHIVVASGVVLAHAAFYTLYIGGDHFEYRVYAHLPVLLFVTAAAMAGRAAPVWLLAMTLASWPIAWTHWRVVPATTDALAVPIAPAFPAPVRPLVAVWDGWQAWLAEHFVGVRQEVHAGFLARMEAEYPSREEGAAIPWDARVVFAAESAGVPGWVWPNVAILDGYGLSDRVIARNPATRPGPRRMAHERMPPEGYLACFRPNLGWIDGAFRIVDAGPRPTDEEIRACEERNW